MPRTVSSRPEEEVLAVVLQVAEVREGFVDRVDLRHAAIELRTVADQRADELGEGAAHRVSGDRGAPEGVFEEAAIDRVGPQIHEDLVEIGGHLVGVLDRHEDLGFERRRAFVPEEAPGGVVAQVRETLGVPLAAPSSDPSTHAAGIGEGPLLSVAGRAGELAVRREPTVVEEHAAERRSTVGDRVGPGRVLGPPARKVRGKALVGVGVGRLRELEFLVARRGTRGGVQKDDDEREDDEVRSHVRVSNVCPMALLPPFPGGGFAPSFPGRPHGFRPIVVPRR